MDNLVERVAFEIDLAQEIGKPRRAEDVARVVIYLAMEEAASLADAMDKPDTYYACGDVAKAIRTRSSEIAGLSKESE